MVRGDMQPAGWGGPRCRYCATKSSRGECHIYVQLAAGSLAGAWQTGSGVITLNVTDATLYKAFEPWGYLELVHLGVLT